MGQAMREAKGWGMESWKERNWGKRKECSESTNTTDRHTPKLKSNQELTQISLKEKDPQN
jgi:hypothetical protein